MAYTEKELQVRKLANGVMFAIWKEDRSGKLLYKFIAKLCGLTRLPAFCIEDKYKPYIVTKEEYEKIKEERRIDMKWCDICHRNELTGEWKSCDSSCPVFGKDFEELAKIVIGTIVNDKRECANCGRFNKETHGCGKYVDDCMRDYNAYSNWIPKGNIKEDF